MHPPAFDYRRVETVAEATGQLAEHGEDARVLAGGQSLIPMLKLRLVAPTILLDISHIPELAMFGRDGGSFVFGAGVRHYRVADSTDVQAHLPIVAEAAAAIGDQQVRNWGTVGGGLAEADPAGNWGTIALATDAELVVEGPEGARSIDVRDFFLDMYLTAMEPEEVLTQLRIPVPGARSGSAFIKFRRRSGDFATASVAVQLTLAPDHTCQSIGIGLGAAATHPLKAESAEGLLVGTDLDDSAVASACDAIDDISEPIADLRGPVLYKKELLKTLFRRALALAAERARGAEN